MCPKQDLQLISTHSLRSVMKHPNRIAYIYAITERERERAALRDRGRDGRFQEIHRRGGMRRREGRFESPREGRGSGR